MPAVLEMTADLPAFKMPKMGCIAQGKAEKGEFLSVLPMSGLFGEELYP